MERSREERHDFLRSTDLAGILSEQGRVQDSVAELTFALLSPLSVERVVGVGRRSNEALRHQMEGLARRVAELGAENAALREAQPPLTSTASLRLATQAPEVNGNGDGKAAGSAKEEEVWQRREPRLLSSATPFHSVHRAHTVAAVAPLRASPLTIPKPPARPEFVTAVIANTERLTKQIQGPLLPPLPIRLDLNERDCDL